MESGYEKGLRLEEMVARLFRSKGYDVKHNVRLIGRSGVEHQIDVFAEYRAPLHTSKIIIECKAYDKPVGKDVVMKLIHEVQDLGVDRGILITTSYFTPDAVATAEGYNIDLWDGVKLRELLKDVEKVEVEKFTEFINVFHIRPVISVNDAMVTINKEVKDALKRGGTIERCSLFFYPYYELDLEVRIYESRGMFKRKIEEKIASVTVFVDPVEGRLCNYDPKMGVIRLVPILELTDDEARAFRILLERGALTVSALAALLNCSTAKARKVVQGLVAKNIIGMMQQGRQTLYGPKIGAPNPMLTRTVPLDLRILGEPDSGVRILPRLSIAAVESFVNLLWRGRVRGHRVVFYPYFVCKISEYGKRYIKAVDLLTNRIDDNMSRILTALYDQLPL